MRLSGTVSCVLLAALSILLGSQCQRSDSNESQIKETAGAFKQAFIEHNEQKLADLLTTDATDYNLTSQDTITGKTEVANFLASLFSTEAMPELSVSIESIGKKGPDMMWVKGLLDLQLANQAKQQVAFKLDFQKEDETWRIARITHLLLQPAPSHYNELKGLDWMVGTWVNEDEGAFFTANFTWDMNKNFLKQNFSMKVLGYKQLSGEQIIGWDPVDSKICSWIFDSDGGFGQSTWTFDTDSWFVTTSYTLADGRKSSSTHIYKPLDGTSYTFSVVGRDVDGRVLPNIGPFTAVKSNKVNNEK